jgi:hypothetical protein
VGSCGLNTSGSGYGPWQAVVNTVMNLRVPEKGGKFLDQPSDCWILKKDSGPWN